MATIQREIEHILKAMNCKSACYGCANKSITLFKNLDVNS